MLRMTTTHFVLPAASAMAPLAAARRVAGVLLAAVAIACLVTPRPGQPRRGVRGVPPPTNRSKRSDMLGLFLSSDRAPSLGA